MKKNDIGINEFSINNKSDSIVQTDARIKQNDRQKKNVSRMCSDTLIIKSGASDLRRQEKSLSKLIENNYNEGLKTDVTHTGFVILHVIRLN
jgi:hypothetical protein